MGGALRDLSTEEESDELQELGWMEKKWSPGGRTDGRKTERSEVEGVLVSVANRHTDKQDDSRL